MLGKYIKSYFEFKFGNLVSGHKDYEKEKQKSYSLRKVKISNTKLSEVLEQACKENNGTLTMSQYFNVDQYGKFGYHKTHTFNGNTTSFEHWGKALAILCKTEDFDEVLDIGAGDARLGIEIVKHSNKIKHKIIWNGLERVEMVETIKNRFDKENLLRFLGKIATDISQIKFNKKILCVFSFSLDSISPEVLLNIKGTQNFPNSILGINVENGVLTEKILSEDELLKKEINFKNGVFRKSGFSYNLKSFSLFPWQRIFLPIDSFIFLAEITKSLPKNSRIVVIDEFVNPPNKFDSDHLCVPKDLATVTRDVFDFDKLYKNSGTYLLYFTTYLLIYIELFKSFGLTNMQWGLDLAFAKFISENSMVRLKHEDIWKSYMITGIKTKGIKKEITLPSPLTPNPEKYNF